MERKDHWETVYKTKSPTEVSWYEPTPEKSLELITKAGISHKQQIIDVGGGASTLVDCLLAEGYGNVTVLDISANAIAQRLKNGLETKQTRRNGLLLILRLPHSLHKAMIYGMTVLFFIF